MAVVAMRTDRGLVLTLTGMADTPPADVTRSLLEATAEVAPPTPVVLDVRDVDVLTVGAARTLVSFAVGCQGRGVPCGLLVSAEGDAARLVLDGVDPAAAVPRFTTVGQALAEDVGAVGERVVDAVGLDAAHQVLSEAYGEVRIEAGGRYSALRLATVGLGVVRFDHVRFAMAFRAETEPLGSFVFGHVRAGSLGDGAEHHYVAGDAFVGAPPDRPAIGEVDDTDASLAVIPPAVLDGVVQSGPGERVRFEGAAVLSAVATWKATYARLRDSAITNPDMEAFPLVTANAARLLAAAALVTFPNTAVVDPTSGDRQDAHPHTLRRSMAYIEDHAGDDMTAADIARAARVTIRAVQLAFRRHLDTTPMAYLRRVRLDCARVELLAAIPGEDTVTRIAGRWGYGRPSAFASHYRAAYGEAPSRTLRER